MLAYSESRAALASGRRAGRLRGPCYAQSIADFESRYAGLAIVGVDEGIARAAAEQAETFGLRGYDAVHLASALALGREEVTLISWDRDLVDAAATLGVAVAGSRG
ncbi:MAG: type II toxin-antitoxin system VapC family toxin [Solirubrobacterales bacterium]